MILPIVGNVTYSITLDPTVWIFDNRKILLEEAFSDGIKNKPENNEAKKAAERWNRALHPEYSKPPVNPNISKSEGEEILKNTYVMPIREFLETAELKPDAKKATLEINDSEDVVIPLGDLKEGYFLFAVEGKPLKDDGPVYFYYRDGSNLDNPIKNIKKIVIS